MSEPAFVPTYEKPDAPGIRMNYDNTVSLYHVVGRDDAFERATADLFAMLQKAQEQYPDWPRLFYVDIDGHRDAHGHFDEDFVELQQEFFFSVLAPFLTAFDLPLTGPLLNPEPQRNDLPGRLKIGG